MAEVCGLKRANSGYPLRARQTLELLDISIKLYQKYFLPLLGCSALVWLVTVAISFVPWVSTGSITGYIDSLIGAVPLAGLAFMLLVPFLYGGVACCLEAAIADREVTAAICLKYAAARYGRTLKAVLVSGVNAGLVFFTFVIFTLASMMLLGLLSDFLATDEFFPYLGLLLLLCLVVLLIFLTGGLTLMPLLACWEGKMKAASLRKRSFILARSGYRRLLGLLITHLAALLALSLIFIGVTMYAVDALLLSESLRGYSSDAETVFYLLDALFSSTAIGLMWSPFFIISLGTFYIDARVRMEAFDLEYAVAGRGKMETTADLQEDVSGVS